MKIELRSGFERGMWVSELRETGGKIDLLEVDCVGSCTFVGDTDESHEITLPDTFKGVVGSYWDLGRSTSLKFLGFTQEELDGPAPERGFYLETEQNTVEPQYATTLRSWLRARAKGVKLLKMEDFLQKYSCGKMESLEDGRQAISVKFRWGDQRAACWAVIDQTGEFVEFVSGMGDRTPYVVDGRFTSAEEAEADFTYACQDVDWRLEEMYGDYIRASYRQGVNPLPALRQKAGGTWLFIRNYTEWEKTHTPWGEIMTPEARKDSRVAWIPQESGGEE